MSEDGVVDAKRSPVFAAVGGLALLFALFSPLILVTMPLLLVATCGVISIFRKENPRWLAPVVVGGAVLVLFSASNQMSNIRGDSASNISSVEIADWSWSAGPDFGTSGTIKWRVSVKNKTDRPIESVEIQFSSFDKTGKLLTTRSSYVNAIPPSGIRNDESFADYYGTEDTANVSVVSVRFSD